MQTEVKIVRWKGDEVSLCDDVVAQEEPLEIRVNGKSLAVTMRTPGDDTALAVGFLLAESVIGGYDDIAKIGYMGKPDRDCPSRKNRLNVTLRPDRNPPSDAPRMERNFLATSACGVCGKATLQAAECLAAPLPDDDFRVQPSLLRSLNDQMRAAQQTFARTGGLHAAGLFDAAGALRTLREDVGRHNAVDKVIGTEAQAGRFPLDRHLLLVSGRASFEIMQKAAMARIPIVCAVSAPSSLAVRLAQDLNITLIGFLRGDTMNVYAHPERLIRSRALPPDPTALFSG